MALPKSTVLYIDDDLINLELFTACFEDVYNVITLSSSKDAIDILKEHEVKVIISDQCMPHETGIDFIKRINEEFPDPLKMILTAYSNHDIALEAINEAGIYKYLLKPWEKNEVKNSIDNAIREYNLKQENTLLLIELTKKNEELNNAYISLEANEKKFHTIFAKGNDSIYILNHEGSVIEANQALYSLLDYKEMPCELKDLNTLIKSKSPVLIDKPLELSKNHNSPIFESEIKTANGETKTVEINCSNICYNDNNYILSVVRDISERRMFEKKIVEAIIKTQEEDQSKYARELHDGLGPLLATLKMHIEWIANPENKNNKDKIIQHSLHAIDNAIRSVKEIANNLSPHILQRFGLVNAVTSYIEHVKQATTMEFVVSSNIKERLPNNIELVLYRAILECINNSVKHSAAKRIIIKFNKSKDNIHICISDNGKGFDYKEVTSSGKGMGLFNIQNRIKHIGGQFKIYSIDNFGTDINITINEA